MVVKRLRTRPAVLITRNASDSAAILFKDPGKGISVASLRSDGTQSFHNRSKSICFAQHSELCTYSEVPRPLSELECRNCFYSKDDVNRFDRDRALTVLMYRTRKGNGVIWDDNIHSLRGLEELFTKHGDKSRTQRRKEHRQAVLREQERLSDPSVLSQLSSAASTVRKSEQELRYELIRGVSCSHSKIDRQRALGYGQKDERNAYRGGSSTRKLLEKIKSKFNGWASLSNRSLIGSDRESLSGEDTDG